MPNPKRRHSKTRGRKRRTHDALKATTPGLCPQCSEPKAAHRVCAYCLQQALHLVPKTRLGGGHSIMSMGRAEGPFSINFFVLKQRQPWFLGTALACTHLQPQVALPPVPSPLTAHLWSDSDASNC